jgi:hypothetical protein
MLLEVIALIERRISILDRLGPPNAAGYTCVGCKDPELHRQPPPTKALPHSGGGQAPAQRVW